MSPCIEPNPIQGFLEAKDPLDLIFLNFIKVDPSKNSKGNILVTINTFFKYIFAIVTPNQFHQDSGTGTY